MESDDFKTALEVALEFFPGITAVTSHTSLSHAARVNVSRNAFSARALKQNIFLDVDIVVKKIKT